MKKLVLIAWFVWPVLVSAQGFVNNSYDKDGNLIVTYMGTDADNYDFIKYHTNGLKCEEGSIKDGMKHGLWKSWSEDGKLIAKAHYKNGMKTGKWVIWNDGCKQVYKIEFNRDHLISAEKLDKNGHVLAKR